MMDTDDSNYSTTKQAMWDLSQKGSPRADTKSADSDNTKSAITEQIMRGLGQRMEQLTSVCDENAQLKHNISKLAMDLSVIQNLSQAVGTLISSITSDNELVAESSLRCLTKINDALPREDLDELKDLNEQRRKLVNALVSSAEEHCAQRLGQKDVITLLDTAELEMDLVGILELGEKHGITPVVKENEDWKLRNATHLPILNEIEKLKEEK